MSRRFWIAPAEEMTVNSSPYAVPAYQKLGFEATEAQQLKDGIIYTPMKYQRQRET